MNQDYYRILSKYQRTLLGSMFVIKIVKAKPEGVELARWMELIFGLHERDIIQYRSNRKFVIPGFYKPAPQVRIAGYRVPRTCPQDGRVWVRFDLKYPNVIDFEAPIAHANEPKLFQLNRDEWDHVKMWLDPIGKENKLFHENDCKANKIRQHR